MVAPRADVDCARVLELARLGLPPTEIARRLRCSPSVVYNRLDRAGVSRRRHDQVAPPRDLVVRLYLDERRSPSEIGAVVGKDAVTIRRYLRNWGVQTRTLGESRVPASCRPAPDDLGAFLLAKYIPEVPMWVARDPVAATAYLAGYVDAEGSFGV